MRESNRLDWQRMMYKHFEPKQPNYWKTYDEELKQIPPGKIILLLTKRHPTQI
jgi:hypothetical protein